MTVVRASKPKSHTLRIALPEQVITLLGPTPEQAARELQILAFVELFRRGEISSGWAAEHLGIGRWDFIELLGKHEVSVWNFTEAELRQDLEVALRLHDKIDPSSSRTAAP